MQAAETFRHEGYTGRIIVVGDEPHTPYDRPPLSKQVLAGEWAPDRIVLPAAVDEMLSVEWRLGRKAAALDLGNRTLTLDDGEELDYEGLVIATGARARLLPGSEGLAGVFALRTLDDCLALRAAVVEGPRHVVVVGGGFIGAEVAATCRKLALPVTIVEPLPVPLGRVLGNEVGQVFADLHRDEGVDVRLGVGVDRIEGNGRVERVVLADGTTLDADVVVIGIGVIPNTEWLEGSGLEVANGVVCDEACFAAPGVVAAGDVASWPNPTFDGEVMRVEHWDHAFAQAAHAARALLAGREEAVPFAAVPWFWSDQYDRKLQLAGRPRPDDEVRVVEGSYDERRFVALYGRAGRLVGVLGMNRPRHVMQLRSAIAERISFDDAAAGF
jgi:NADPH-dependent 2,4-dienoyl-CoA reductase/sulfur reductase-like enzyme